MGHLDPNENADSQAMDSRSYRTRLGGGQTRETV